MEVKQNFPPFGLKVLTKGHSHYLLRSFFIAIILLFESCFHQRTRSWLDLKRKFDPIHIHTQ